MDPNPYATIRNLGGRGGGPFHPRPSSPPLPRVFMVAWTEPATLGGGAPGGSPACSGRGAHGGGWRGAGAAGTFAGAALAPGASPAEELRHCREQASGAACEAGGLPRQPGRAEAATPSEPAWH